MQSAQWHKLHTKQNNVRMYSEWFLRLMDFHSLGNTFLQSSQLFFCITPGNVVLLDLMLKGNARCVTLSYQDPVRANGRIIRFDIKIAEQNDRVKNGSREWESIPVNRSDADSSSNQSKITVLKEILLPYKKYIKVYVNAVNSVGESPTASLFIPKKAQGRYPW